MNAVRKSLIAYADGTLDPATCAEVEAALVTDPSLRAELDEIRRLERGLRETLTSIAAPANLEERLWKHVEQGINAPKPVVRSRLFNLVLALLVPLLAFSDIAWDRMTNSVGALMTPLPSRIALEILPGGGLINVRHPGWRSVSTEFLGEGYGSPSVQIHLSPHDRMTIFSVHPGVIAGELQHPVQTQTFSINDIIGQNQTYAVIILQSDNASPLGGMPQGTAWRFWDGKWGVHREMHPPGQEGHSSLKK